MKIAIMTDMEGVAGIMNHDDWVIPEGRYYECGKALLTEEANAAIDGFFAAGADEIVVIDGHGAGGVDPQLLDDRALLSRGWGVYHQFGLNENFDALAWVGQHAKSGALLAHMAHSGSFHVLEDKINGISMGEFGVCAAIGGFYGASAIFGSGDEAFAKEAKALIPQIHAAAVKRGVNMTEGANLNAAEYGRHTLGAVHMHPKRARAAIRKEAEKALRSFFANPENYQPLRLSPPYIFQQWFRAEKTGGAAARKVFRHESDIVAMFSSEAEI